MIEKNIMPETIEELKQWYIDMNLPDENTTRFFIGKDYPGPKAFGIYKNDITNEFVVYKNKADGSRAVRYQGTDEAFAVKELYLRLKDEIANQNNNNPIQDKTTSKSLANSLTLKLIPFCDTLILVVVTFVGVFISSFSPDRGYYNFRGKHYYYQNSSWYVYDTSWSPCYNVPSELKKNYNEYYSSRSNTDYLISDFESSAYYEEPSYSSSSSSSSSWDSDSSWDSSDSWDSSSTDWDSDW